MFYLAVDCVDRLCAIIINKGMLMRKTCGQDFVVDTVYCKVWHRDNYHKILIMLV